MPDSYSENKRGIQNGRARPVRCIETGEVFQTGRELARCLGTGRSYVSVMMGRGRPLKGLHYEFIDKGEITNGVSFSESKKNPDED